MNAVAVSAFKSWVIGILIFLSLGLRDLMYFFSLASGSGFTFALQIVAGTLLITLSSLLMTLFYMFWTIPLYYFTYKVLFRFDEYIVQHPQRTLLIGCPILFLAVVAYVSGFFWLIAGNGPSSLKDMYYTNYKLLVLLAVPCLVSAVCYIWLRTKNT